jgi:hypothetical protein
MNPMPGAPPSTGNPYNYSGNPLPGYPIPGGVSTNPGGGGLGTTLGGPVTLKDNNGNPLTTGNLFGQNPGQENWLLNEMQHQFGSGVGSMLFQFLQSGGGYNLPLAQQDVNATNAAMMNNINLGYGSLGSTLAGQGISPNSSASALEVGNFMSSALTNMNAIDASVYEDMWNQSMNRETQMLGMVGQEGATNAANQTTLFGKIAPFLGPLSLGISKLAGLKTTQGGSAFDTTSIPSAADLGSYAGGAGGILDALGGGGGSDLGAAALAFSMA